MHQLPVILTGLSLLVIDLKPLYYRKADDARVAKSQGLRLDNPQVIIITNEVLM